MNNLQQVWGKRFFQYMRELQRYMQYIFTGHLAIVLVFTIGALGYSYSEWLKTVPETFPAALITALILSAAIVVSSPVTLLKEADIVFWLPLEGQLPQYIKKSLSWTTFSQLPLPIGLYIVLLPLLTTVNMTDRASLLWLALFIIVFKWFSVESEFAIRFALHGRYVWLDRLIRFLFIMLAILAWLSDYYYLLLLPVVAFVVYMSYWKKQMANRPFPYAHFIQQEQNRMMRFYQFANYFTDVPHIKGAISRRRWLNPFLIHTKIDRALTQQYLIQRTFIRTDDIFRLWLRLTIIVVVGTYLIPFKMAMAIFIIMISFASSIQLIHALRLADEFKMDMLYPIPNKQRVLAVRKVVRHVQWVQAIVIGIAAFFSLKLSIYPIVFIILAVIISEMTIRFTKQQ